MLIFLIHVSQIHWRIMAEIKLANYCQLTECIEGMFVWFWLYNYNYYMKIVYFWSEISVDGLSFKLEYHHKCSVDNKSWVLML